MGVESKIPKRRVLKIAICEDNPEDMKKLMSAIYDAVPNVDISGYTNAESFLLENEARGGSDSGFDMVFFDIYMKGMNGMDAAKELRKTDSKCLIVFTTSTSDYAIEGYKVEALNYFLKPVNPDDIKEVLGKVYADNNTWRDVITLTSEYRKVDVPLSQIIYIEVNDKYCIFHMSNKNIKSRMSMNDLSLKLKSPFLRCHRGFMVNMNYIQDINNDVQLGSNFLMKNGESVPIRKKDYSRIKEEYLKYLMDLSESE